MRRCMLSLLSMVLISGCVPVPPAETAQTGGNGNLKEPVSDGLWTFSELSDTSYEETALPSDPSWSLSFWLRPESNYPDTELFRIQSGKKELFCVGSTYDGTDFTGITLLSSGQRVAVAEETVSTRRWNYIVYQQSQDTGILYLNGNEILRTKIKDMEHAVLSVGRRFDGCTPVHGRIAETAVTDRMESSETIRQVYEARYPAVLLDTVSFPDQNHLRRSLWLDSNEIEGVALNWKVLDQDRMDYRGIISDLSKEGDIRTVASIQTEAGYAEKSFVFHVAGDEPEQLIQEDIKELDCMIAGVLHSEYQLPMSGSHGSTVRYAVVSGRASIENGVLKKLSGEAKEPVVIEAEVQLEDQTVTKEYRVILLDEIYGYAMAYFNGELGEEKGSLAISTDALHWEKCESVSIQASLGSKRLRDPSLSRTKEGTFLLAATQGFDHPEIYLFQSEDLIHYTDEKMVLADVPDQGLHMSGERAWAPFVLYDAQADLYRIAFSDPHDQYGAIYSITSPDLETFSYPSILFDPGYPVIDGVMFRMNGRYWMFYKDERKAAQTVFYAASDDLNAGFQKAYDQRFLHPVKGLEGPIVFAGKDRYYIYVDRFGFQTFYAGTFTALGEEADISWLEEESYTLPEEVVRHGSVVPVTKAEYEMLSKNGSK